MRAARAIGKAPWSWRNFNRRALPQGGPAPRSGDKGGASQLETDHKLFESEDGREALHDVLMGQLGEFFRPEFLNRIGDVVVFRSVSKVDLRKIVDI